MVNVTAKLRIKGKSYEILVDVDKALQLKQGKPVSMSNLLASNTVFSDIKKGMRVPEAELVTAFSTSDINLVAERIIKNGEINIPADYRNKEREDRLKQVIDFLSRNALDPTTKRPHTPERIKSAIEQAGVNIDSRSVEEQIGRIIEKLRVLIPISMESKKIEVTIPAVHTGRVYGMLQDYKESEEWMNNGDLKVVINLPVGIQMDFYDKLNGVTHGSAITRELK
jgi:ribosome maturation protein SDO1